MPRPKSTDEFLKTTPSCGEIIARMLEAQEADVLDAIHIKTLAKYKNKSGLFDIVQPEYIEPNKIPKKIVKLRDAELIAKNHNFWIFKL